MAMALSPLPVCLLPSHCPPLFVQQWVAMVVQLFVPLERRDPAHPVPSTRPALLSPGRADPNRQCHRQGAAHCICLQPARTQPSPAGKAASTSAVCKHKQLLGAGSETPAWAVPLPAPLFQSTMKAKGWLKAPCPTGRAARSSVLWDKPAPASPTVRSKA